MRIVRLSKVGDTNCYICGKPATKYLPFPTTSGAPVNVYLCDKHYNKLSGLSGSLFRHVVAYRDEVYKGNPFTQNNYISNNKFMSFIYFADSDDLWIGGWGNNHDELINEYHGYTDPE